MRILNPYMPESFEREESACPGIITDQMVEFNLESSYTGLLNRSKQGTNIAAVMWGQLKDEMASPLPGAKFQHEKILYWPEGGGALDISQVASRGYSIIGSWNSWSPQVMESLGNGQYAFTVTLGANRWERFQITLDGDRAKTLHPNDAYA